LFSNGILTYLKNLIWTKKTISDYFRIEKEGEDVYADIAFAYVGENNDNVISFVNNIHTPDGWTHLNWFKAGLLKALNEYAKENKLLDKKIWELQLGDVTSGLYAIVSVKVPEPQFEWQTKWKLWNAYVRKEIEKLVYEYVKSILADNEELAKVIIERVKINAKARMAAKLARETVMRKNAMSMGVLPGKLTDCSARKREWTEVFIVEGDSAGGSAKQARDSKFQAIFPLRGKILNTEKSALDKILQNNEVKSLIIWLWAGLKEAYDEEKLRYDKVIIMTDADVDGAHIRTLLLTFFFRYMKPLIENGHMYIAVSPLYKFTQGKKVKYIYPPEYDVDEAMKKYGFDPAKTSIQRYKGLWEMNPEQLWETTMNPETRKLLQVTIEDAQKADEIFTTLMGTEIAPRRNFILTHAKNIRNLDI
jgi:DNA gyrase subunit B